MAPSDVIVDEVHEMITRVIVGAFCGLSAMFFTWLISHESSPAYRFFLANESLADIWRILNFPVLMVLLVTQIDYPPFALLLIFIEWFLIGFFAWWIGTKAIDLSKSRS